VVKYYFFALLIGFLFQDIQPNWLDYEQRHKLYPQNEFITGFASRHFSEGENLNIVQNEVKTLSRIELTESFQIDIQSSTMMEFSSGNQGTATEYEKTIITKSNLEAYGLTTETYLDKNEGIAYGFSFISIRDLKLGYYRLLQKKWKEAELLYDESKLTTAFDSTFMLLNKVNSKLYEIANIQNMLYALGMTSDEVLEIRKRNNYTFQVREDLKKLRSSHELTLDQAMKFMFYDMNSELKGRIDQFQILPLTFKNTQVPTQFSDFMMMQTKGSAVRQFKITEDLTYTYKLAGSYWPMDETIKVTFDLKEYIEDMPVMLLYSSAINVPMNEIEKYQLEYDISDDLEEKNHFEIIRKGVVNGGMSAKVSTQRGTQGLIFKEGDPVDLFVKLSRPGYVRLLNIWNDGTKILLSDNFHIDKGDVNQYVRIQSQFQVACPCGVEYVKLLAQSEPFESVETVKESGFDLISQPIEIVLENTRGLQKIKQADPDYYFGESVIIMSTMK
jgi:hypothetical protein